MAYAEMAGLTPREPEQTFGEMITAIRDNLSDHASSDNGENGDDEDEETGLGKVREDDEPSWVMGTISKMVQQRIESFRQKQMKIDELTQLGWEDAADDFRERDKKYGTAESRVLVVVQPQTDDDILAPPPTTFGELMESLDIVPGILQTCVESAAEPNTLHLLKAKPVEPLSLYP
jgi:phosphoglycerate dehydrogenase-like enzyme